LIRPIVCGVWKFGLTLTYAAVATVMVQPLLNFRELGTSSYEGDARFMIWTLAWNNHAVLQGLPLFDANTFFPAERALAYTGAISWWPGFSGFRAPARYAVLVVLSLSVLGAAGAAALQRRFGPKGTVAVVALLPIMLSEWFVLDFPAGKPQPFHTPAIYALPAVQQARALVSLPDYRGTPDWYLGADYLLFSTTHWRRIVNGYGRAEPPGHPRIISHMNAFPGPNNARTMRAIGVEYVVVHSARYRDGALTLLEGAISSPEYELVETLGTDYLFRVKPGP
jgi:hypothetical protein